MEGKPLIEYSESEALKSIETISKNILIQISEH
jgi:hypothetical protein